MLKIQTWTDNEILRKVSEEIKQEEFKTYLKLGKEMVKYIKNPKNWWIWLAAPQVWHNKRLIVVSLLKDREDEKFSTIMMINPVILEMSEETCMEKEWCYQFHEKKEKLLDPKI
jgi:peptide deformylase